MSEWTKWCQSKLQVNFLQLPLNKNYRNQVKQAINLATLICPKSDDIQKDNHQQPYYVHVSHMMQWNI